MLLRVIKRGSKEVLYACLVAYAILKNVEYWVRMHLAYRNIVFKLSLTEYICHCTTLFLRSDTMRSFLSFQI